jgi:hypothetical protein
MEPHALGGKGNTIRRASTAEHVGKFTLQSGICFKVLFLLY